METPKDIVIIYCYRTTQNKIPSVCTFLGYIVNHYYSVMGISNKGIMGFFHDIGKYESLNFTEKIK